MIELTPDTADRCGCPTNEFGDIRCHVCGERVNKRCWNCKTPRGEGVCPNPRPVPPSVPEPHSKTVR